MNAINTKTYKAPPDTDRPELTPERIIGENMRMMVAHVKAWKVGKQDKLNTEDRELAAGLIAALGRNAWAITGVDDAGNLLFMRRLKSAVHMLINESPKAAYYQKKGEEIMKKQGWVKDIARG